MKGPLKRKIDPTKKAEEEMLKKKKHYEAGRQADTPNGGEMKKKENKRIFLGASKANGE